MNKKYIKFSELVKNRGKYIQYIGRKKWKTKQDLIYWLDFENKNEYIIIPKGFECDFNSSPVFTHFIVDRDEFSIAIFHDYLYSMYGEVRVINTNNLSDTFIKLQKYGSGFSIYDTEDREFYYDRKFADLVWKMGALEESINIFRRKMKTKINLGYFGIRIGGLLHFKN